HLLEGGFTTTRAELLEFCDVLLEGSAGELLLDDLLLGERSEPATGLEGIRTELVDGELVAQLLERLRRLDELLLLLGGEKGLESRHPLRVGVGDHLGDRAPREAD